MSENHSSGGYEKKDENFKALVALTVLLIVVVIGSMVFCWGLNLWMRPARPVGDRPMSPMADMHRLPPEPRLQVNDAVDMVKMREETQAVLDSYGWIDKTEGTVRLPIDRAIELIGQRGLPARREAKP